MASAIKGIIWDFGNILASFDHLKACRKFARFGDISPERIFILLFSGENAPAKLHEAGVLSSHQFYLEVRRMAGLSGLSFRVFSLIWKEIFTENWGVSAVIDAIRPDVMHCILSNTDPIHWSAIEQLPVMKKHFSDQRRLVRSYTVGARKPSPRMYNEALKRLGPTVDIDEVLYIEDVAEYCNTFKRMGGHVLPYDCSKDTLGSLKAGLGKFNAFNEGSKQ